MNYTALEKMRSINNERYGIDGPLQPPEVPETEISGELERIALRFIRESCRELRFKRDEEHMELRDLDGKSTSYGQIPLNMERDIDRACLENAIHRFMKTGSAEDAFSVYFCYLEMFIGDYKSSRKMIELLSEFESNGSSLLMKHRDHYSHSVYVFVLGLALYEKSSYVKKAYNDYYGLKDRSAHHFLKYWGLAALFHDIGYPFELPFEQIKSYFGNTIENVPYISYRGTDSYGLSQSVLSALSGSDKPNDNKLTPFSVLAENLTDKFYPAYSGYENYQKFLADNGLDDCRASYSHYLRDAVLRKKPKEPAEFGGFMDHAVFSALILMHKLSEVLPAEELSGMYTDVLTAIVLHNSMYRYSITNVKSEKSRAFNKAHRLQIQTHPLAYILTLCDELQCWDRVAYGQNSRRQFHPFGCNVTIDGDCIRAEYRYDESLASERAGTGTYAKMRPSGTSCTFLSEIEDILSINEESGLSLTVSAVLQECPNRSNIYLSGSSFMHLYDFAVALNAQYEARDYTTKEFKNVPPEIMDTLFDHLSMEYKLSNIMQAQAFGKYLNDIDCFFTDKQVAFKLKRSFTLPELDSIGQKEHDRWDCEKEQMGWQYGTAFLNFPDKKAVREQTRTHNDLNVPYHSLSAVEQAKDTAPMNDMMRLLENYDGLRIYSIK